MPISVYEEYLDLNRFAGAVYRESVQSHFREKYRGNPIGAIVAFGPVALDYAIAMRADLWPAVELGRLHLPICQTFPLVQVSQALEMMKSNRHFGKIAIVM